MKNVLIIGSGKRVQEAALPAMFRAAEQYSVQAILARTQKQITVEGRVLQVDRLVDLQQDTLDTTDLIYMVVGKNSVPDVLKSLRRLDVSSVDLLIDTPVLRFKHLGHLGLLDAFRNTWVPEDCTTLPVFDVIESALHAGLIGELRRVVCDRSAYAYHGIAMGRRLFHADRVSKAKQTKLAGGTLQRTIHYDTGGELSILAPRDYAVGHIEVEGNLGTLSDDPANPEAHALTAIVDEGACIGFEVGELRTLLTESERSLMGAPKVPPGARTGVWIWMEGMKRVGFLRLLHQIAEGRGAYPLAHAVEDTVVDYHLERLHRYRSNPFTSAHFASARLLMRVLTRVTGG